MLGMVVFAVKLARTMKDLDNSFAKLGYLAREDAKKYFGDAADKVVDMNSSFYQQYQKMIEDGVRTVLAQSGEVMEGSLKKAQAEAGQITVKAQADAQGILQTAREDSRRYFDQAVSEAVDAIEWAMEQYIKDHVDVRQHEEIITKLIEAYINERKPG